MSPTHRLRVSLALVVATIMQIGNNLQTHSGAGGDTIIFISPTSTNFLVPSLSSTAASGESLLSRRYGNANLTAPSNPHPHAGAIDEFGHYDYVHDPIILHRIKPDFHVSEEEKKDLCAPVGYGPEGYEKLARRFFTEHIEIATPPSSKANNIKVFCAVYTHAGNNNQTEAIRQTWGRRCDGFMAASTETNHDTATVHLPHQGLYQGQYKGIWQKVRSIVAYFHDHFLNEYDYLYLSGDDTYVIMENLKAFLASPKVTENDNPYFYSGARTHPIWMKKQNDYDPNFFYMGGGAGYILNRDTVQAIVKDILPACHEATVGSAEDVHMGRCLQNVLNVTGFDSRDDQERDRFIQYDPLRRAGLPNPADRNFMRYVQQQNGWLQEHYNWTAQYGIDAIAPSAISFHMIQPATKMRRYERLLYRMHDEYYQKLDCE